MTEPHEEHTPNRPPDGPINPPQTALIALALVALGALGLVVYMVRYSPAFMYGSPDPYDTTVWSSPTYTSTDYYSSASPTPSFIYGDAITRDESKVAWLKEPEKLSEKLDIFAAQGEIADADELEGTTYYKVGTDDGKDLLVVTPSQDGPGSLNVLFLIKDDGSHFRLFQAHSSTFTDVGDYSGWPLSEKVAVDVPTTYPSLKYQSKLFIDNVILENPYKWMTFYTDSWSGLGEDPDQYSVFAQTDYGTLYRHQSSTDDKSTFSGEIFVLVRPNFTTTTYEVPVTFVTDDGLPRVTWADGTKNADQYRYDGFGGCGSGGPAVLKKVYEKDLKATGKTVTGENIYEFATATHPTLKEFYDSYVAGQEDPISQEEYFARHGVFAYKDGAGRYLLFSSLKYGVAAECGKPVVYLYPEAKTDVSVKVGADVTISEPTYGSGWQVTAEPNGNLTMADGNQYRSLFWEGTGHGNYPTIGNGFVVAREDLEPTLRDHLTRLGLNAQESADFLEFWLPRMPETPYTRLTWFGTQQMDELAPLTITPKPDTSIRIFLDFAGLEAPIELPTQKLGMPARRGFTVVEWGGILR